MSTYDTGPVMVEEVSLNISVEGEFTPSTDSGPEFLMPENVSISLDEGDTWWSIPTAFLIPMCPYLESVIRDEIDMACRLAEERDFDASEPDLAEERDFDASEPDPDAWHDARKSGDR